MIALLFPICSVCGRRLTCVGTSRRDRMCSNACRLAARLSKP
jgi:recombinational DNA repair protein (RecF pathway)